MSNRYFFSYVIRDLTNLSNIIAAGDGVIEVDKNRWGSLKLEEVKESIQEKTDKTRKDESLPPLNWDYFIIHVTALNRFD